MIIGLLAVLHITRIGMGLQVSAVNDYPKNKMLKNKLQKRIDEIDLEINNLETKLQKINQNKNNFLRIQNIRKFLILNKLNKLDEEKAGLEEKQVYHWENNHK